MEIHVRKDGYFVEDDSWRESLERYRAFMAKASQLTSVTLARFNRDFPGRQADMGSFIPFGEDIARVLADVMKPEQAPLHDSARAEQ